jgi:predicted Zn finger-like uncharacterized protein
MFTVCPKCALTLVVTAADLKVAQGYVRCGRCSNVFNAIVGLSEDRSGGSSAGAGPLGASPGGSTASTSVVRKAPSISDDDPPPDPLSDTGENEAIYAEPEQQTEEISVQDVFADTGAPLPIKAPVKPPQPVRRAAPPPEPQEFSDSIPDVALEFNPEATDVSQVFVEPVPTKKIDLRPPSPPPPPPPRASQPRALPPQAPPPQAPLPRPRDAEDLQIEDELRSLAAKLDATGKQQTLKPEKPAPRAESKPAPKVDSTNAGARNKFSGSPYNSADGKDCTTGRCRSGCARKRGSARSR